MAVYRKFEFRLYFDLCLRKSTLNIIIETMQSVGQIDRIQFVFYKLEESNYN